MRFHTLVVTAVLALTACTRDTSFTADIEDSVALRKRVLARVPIGTRLDSAVRILEKNGFSCPAPNPTVGRSWVRTCSKESSGGNLAILRQKFNINFFSKDSLGSARGLTQPMRADSIETFTRMSAK